MFIPPIKVDVIIAGGGVGGVAAAIALLESDRKVLLVEETDWLGGQFSSQAVPPDEHPWIEKTGGSQLYRNFRNRVRQHYRENYPLRMEEAGSLCFDPGRAGVSRLSHEPRVAQLALEEMLSPYIARGPLSVLKKHAINHVERSGENIRSVSILSKETGRSFTLDTPFILDATELGDLLELGKIDHVTGSEGSSATGELHAPSSHAEPLNMQAITWVAALGYDSTCPEASDRYRIEKPKLYDFWKNSRPALAPAWPGSLLSWTYSSPFTLAPLTRGLFPDMWTYRRALASCNFATPTQECSIFNWPQNDYFEHEILCCTPEERETRYDRARQLTLSMIYWMQNEAPREDGKTGYAGLHLRPDLTGTPDGLAKYPYIRESRRLKAIQIITEADVGVAMREGRPPEPLSDSVGTGYYRIDLHPSTGGNNYIDIEAFPFQIPLGCLIAPTTTNFLAAGKNIGTTHISNGCYRLHPVEWSIGEAAGRLAAFCLERKIAPQQVHGDGALLQEYQGNLERGGACLRWPDTIYEEHAAFTNTAKLPVIRSTQLRSPRSRVA